MFSRLFINIRIRFSHYIWALQDSPRLCMNSMNKDSESSAKCYLFLLVPQICFLDIFLSNCGLLSHIAHPSRPLSAASTASSSFAPSQWQSGPVALMNAVINSRTHSLFRPLKLLLSASNSTTRHLCCYSICAPRRACTCECQPMYVCAYAQEGAWWTISCDYHLFHPLIFKPLQIPSSKQNGRLTLSPLAPSNPCKRRRQHTCTHTDTHTHTNT